MSLKGIQGEVLINHLIFEQLHDLMFENKVLNTNNGDFVPCNQQLWQLLTALPTGCLMLIERKII